MHTRVRLLRGTEVVIEVLFFSDIYLPQVAVAVQQRFGKSILELGGNNAIIVAEDADLEALLQSVVFACCGTAGQRCTSTRRLILHSKVGHFVFP